MQSRFNGTRVTDGYEIVRSVTADEIFAGTLEKRRYCSFEQVLVASSTPLAGKGCVASRFAKCSIWAWFVIVPKRLSPGL